jgi:hypothetical protein
MRQIREDLFPEKLCRRFAFESYRDVFGDRIMSISNDSIIKGIFLIAIIVLAGFIVTGLITLVLMPDYGESVNLKKWVNEEKIVLPVYLETLAANGSSYPLRGYIQFYGNVSYFRVTYNTSGSEKWLLEPDYGSVDHLSFNVSENQMTELAVSLKETLQKIINGETMSYSTYTVEFQDNPERYKNYDNPRRIETCYYGNDGVAIQLYIFPDRVVAYASSYTMSIEYKPQIDGFTRRIFHGKISICYYIEGISFDELVKTNKYLITCNSLLESLIS